VHITCLSRTPREALIRVHCAHADTIVFITGTFPFNGMSADIGVALEMRFPWGVDTVLCVRHVEY